VQDVTLTLNGLSHTFPSDIDMLLVSPSGRKVVVMSDFGAGAPGVTGINLTLDDYAPKPVPSTVTGNTGVPFVTGTYRPANSGTTDQFPAPAPLPAGGAGTAYDAYTFSQFNGDSPNGTWNLYIVDDANLDGGSISGGWTLTFQNRPAAPTAGQVLINEFRARGVGTAPPTSDGSADEFIELYNNTDSSITIIDAIPGADPTLAAGAGWRFGAAQGATETTFLVLPQTLSTAGPLAIPARGHFLVTTQPTTPSPAGNTYSLSTYPTGTGITASGAANISINPAVATTGFMPDDVGLALFSQANPVSANRLDSVGYSGITNADYKEGTGLSPSTGITTSAQASWVRKVVGLKPQDTNDNAADFRLVETTAATLNGVAAVLGAPGPERGPTATAFTTTDAPGGFGGISQSVIDPLQPNGTAPNTVRDLTAVTNGALGTLKLRRRFTNNTGGILVALRYRIVDISTLTGGTVPVGQADLRVLNAPLQTITLTDTTSVNSQATTLQTPPTQASGGGLNSSLAEGVITTTAPLANGASTIVEFNLGVMVDGLYKLNVLVEGLNVPPSAVQGGGFNVTGCTGGTCGGVPTAAPATISGRITTPDGSPLAGVTLNLSGGRTGRVITDASGNYSFTGVSTDSFYTVTPELVTYHFSPGERSFSLLSNRSDAVFTASRDAASVGNLIDSPDYFVRQHYLDFLGREPDEAGFNFWGDQIRGCGGDSDCIQRRTINVSAAYFLSIEFQQTGGLVDALYRASYARRPQFAEFMPDTNTVARNVVVGQSGWAQTLEANKQAFIDAWMQRADFRAAYDGLANAAYVDTLIAHAGTGFNGDRAALVNGLNNNALTRSAVLRQVVENEGFVNAKRNETFVMMQYFGYLRRDPDAAGYQFWLNKLNQFNGNFEQAEMVKAFLISGEYRSRFLQ